MSIDLQKKPAKVNPIPRTHKIVGQKNGSDKILSYCNCPKDDDGWVDAGKYLPNNYDLVFIKTKNKVYSGWYSINCWDGYGVKEDIEVICWKKNNLTIE